MNVKKLKELLADAPEELEVMVMVGNHLKPGMFAFAPACECETGVQILGPDEHMIEREEKVFLVLPHGAGVPEDEVDNIENQSPELN